MRTFLSRAAVLAVLAAAVMALPDGAVTPRPAAAVEAVRYQPPVKAQVIDVFRPPRHRFGAGNRGLLYDTNPGQRVSAAGAGRVAFAGSVAGRLVVSIDHADGLRTTYTGLGSVTTTRGERVEIGGAIGTAAATLHVGARVGSAYLDPALIFDDPPRVYLVPTRAR
jgi:murein DD-endopeptidase MepM/ murein hydrolase activator NlpD